MDKKSYSTIASYIDRNPIATLGTLNSDGSPHGSVIYICADAYAPTVYFVTKQGTQKYKNLSQNSKVSLTATNPAENSTLQASGQAFIIREPATIDTVMKKIASEHDSTREWLPPIAKVQAGAYEVIGVRLEYARLARFKGMALGSEEIFTGGKI